MSRTLICAVDCVDWDLAKKRISQLYEIQSIDIVEIGNPLIIKFGAKVADLLGKGMDRSKFYTDTKIIDFPIRCIRPYVDVGFRKFSILAGIDNESLSRLAKFAIDRKLEIFVSMMGYPIDNMRQRGELLRQHGYTSIICHGAGANKSSAFSNMLSQLNVISGSKSTQIFAAGGIDTNNISCLSGHHVSGIVVGRGLIDSPDATRTSKMLKYK